MKNYRHILFDMDGTLIDSGRGIVESVRYTLKLLGLSEPNEEVLFSFVGPPLKSSFIKLCNMNSQEAEIAVKIFRTYYSNKGMFNVSLYPGIKKMLHELRERGYTLFIATSKPTEYAQRIAEFLKIAVYFDDIVGSNLDNSRVQKSEVIQYLLKKNNCSEPIETLMVGDKEQDMIGAHSCGIDAVGVTFGYGSRAELEAQHPVAIINSPLEFLDFMGKQAL